MPAGSPMTLKWSNIESKYRGEMGLVPRRRLPSFPKNTPPFLYILLSSTPSPHRGMRSEVR